MTAIEFAGMSPKVVARRSTSNVEAFGDVAHLEDMPGVVGVFALKPLNVIQAWFASFGST